MNLAVKKADIESGYKQTELGLIPSDWDLLSLQDVASKDGLVRGPFGGALKKNQFVNSGYKVYEQKNAIYATHEIGDYFINDEKFKELYRFRVTSGDLIVSCSGTIGCIYQVPQGAPEGVINQALLKIKLNSSVISDEYFRIIFESVSFQSRIKENSHGGAMQNLVGMETFRQTKLQIPRTKKEQEAIAETLNDADALIEALEQLIAKKHHIKQGAMQDLLTGKKRLAGFEKKWIEKTFGEVFDFLSTATNSRADLNDEGQAFYIHYGDIHTRFHSHLSLSEQKPSKTELFKCRNAALVKNGDWIMADASEDYDGVGKSIEIVGLSENDVMVSGLHTFLLREKVPTFVSGFKGHLGNSSSLRKQYLRVMTGMKVFGVSKTALRDLILQIPEENEQLAITEILNGMDAEIATIEFKLEKAKHIKQGMMQDLLTGRLRLV